MLTEITKDDQLKKLLLYPTGFLVNVDYPTKDVKMHKTDCKYCNPSSSIGIKPSSKRQNKTGEIWYSSNRKEAHSKAKDVASRKGYNYSSCALCNP